MAQYGGGLPTFTNQLPPARIQPQPVVPVPREFITLAQRRAGRKQNEYIDTPLRPQPSLKSRLKEERRDVSIIVEDTPDTGLPGVHRSFIRNSTRSVNNTRFDSQSPVSVQPTTTFKKNKYENVADPQTPEDDSIICRQCNKCKCGACRSTRQMPERWICNDECLCSVQNVVDYCTCFCCVKALFYHCAKDREVDINTTCADNPCSCGSQHRCLRWSCMGIMSMLIPCLCFYWPLTGCVKLCEMSYAKVMSRGCRCTTHRRTVDPPERAPQKRLLDFASDC